MVEVLAAHLKHAEQHYRRADGSQTHEVVEYKIAYRVIRVLYGRIPAVEFGPLALKAVRAAMLAKGWCRSLINQRIGRVRRIFKWAAGEELVPFAVYHALTAVTGLQAGRTSARESEPIGPVDDATTEATLPFLSRHVRGLVEFQRLTGCRPGEACLLRRCDIDTGGAVWLYKPAHHKLAYKNKSRVIAIGPQGQNLLREYFTPDIGDYLFSPRRSVEEIRAARAASRKTPRFTSHMERNAMKRKAKPERAPGEKYNGESYGRAIAKAVEAHHLGGIQGSHQHPSTDLPFVEFQHVRLQLQAIGSDHRELLYLSLLLRGAPERRPVQPQVALAVLFLNRIPKAGLDAATNDSHAAHHHGRRERLLVAPNTLTLPAEFGCEP